MNVQRLFFSFIYLLFVLLFIIASFLLIVYALGPPELESKETITIVDQDGKVINETIDNIHHLDDLPSYAVEGIVLVEDQHFYEHYGLYLRGIARAFIRNLEAGKLKEGASTITQQLARNLYLSHEKTWTRKLKELYYTIRLELFYSKDEILTAYLNTIYFGHGAYGINAASDYYFGKNAEQLSIAEATMLIGIPKGPTYYSPYNDINNATKRQHYILKQLLQKQAITEAEYYEAKHEKLPFQNEPSAQTNHLDYFIDYVWQEITETLQINKKSLLTNDVTIETTLDLSLQQQSEQMTDRDVWKRNDIELSTLSLDPHTGAIRQMIGGKDYQTSPFNRAVQSKRMVGSTFKPLLYYAALENGFTATTMLQSEPTVFTIGDDTYEPSNYNDYYAYQPISLAQALALSDNIYAVKTHLYLSTELVINTAKQLGITTPLPEVTSLALGSASIPLIEMVQAYATITNGGYETIPYAIERITTENGKVIYEKEHNDRSHVLNEQKAFLLTHLLTGMFDRRLNGYMEVTGSSIIDQLHHEYAGKSGTTDADSWMIGASPQLVTGVWTGYDDNRSLLALEEKALAKSTWAELMQLAHSATTEKLTFPIPEGIVSKVVDVETGLLATEDCATTRTTYFEIGTEPTTYCTNHLPVEREDELVSNDSEPSLMRKLLNFLP